MEVREREGCVQPPLSSQAPVDELTTGGNALSSPLDWQPRRAKSSTASWRRSGQMEGCSGSRTPLKPGCSFTSLSLTRSSSS